MDGLQGTILLDIALLGISCLWFGGIIPAILWAFEWFLFYLTVCGALGSPVAVVRGGGTSRMTPKMRGKTQNTQTNLENGYDNFFSLLSLFFRCHIILWSFVDYSCLKK